MNFERRAEQIARSIRRKIIDGILEEGAILPNEDALRDLYPVSKPTLKEALRILEAEGLITVLRGNVGGARVHRPSATHVAYTMTLFLSANRVALGDVAVALRELGPAGAALCALRPDRVTTVLPVLHEIQEQARASIGNLADLRCHSQRFHEALIRLSGNATLAMMAAAADAVWASHTSGYRTGPIGEDQVLEDREAAMRDHEEIMQLIVEGDAVGARNRTSAHIGFVQSLILDDEAVIDPMLTRAYLHHKSAK